MLLLTKRNLKNIKESIKVNYRTMFTTRQLTKNVNMNLIRQGVGLKGHCVQSQVNRIGTQGVSHKKDYAVYRIADTNANNSTHEQAQVNPILTSAKGKPFQHPSYVRDTCDADTTCDSKICKKLCGDIEKSSYVGHGTHDGTVAGAVFISHTDLNNNLSAQYGVMYKKPINNPDISGMNTNNDKTNNLNNNKEMADNVHLNSSQNNSDS